MCVVDLQVSCNFTVCTTLIVKTKLQEFWIFKKRTQSLNFLLSCYLILP